MKISNAISIICIVVLSCLFLTAQAQTSIGSADELAAIGQNEESLAGSYLLTTDLTLENWIPVGGLDDFENKGFSGTFDGGGHTITITSFGDVGGGIAVGLFGGVENEGVIKNLRVAGNANYTATQKNVLCIGGIAGVNRGSIMYCRSDIALKGDMLIDGKTEKVKGGARYGGVGVYGGGIAGINVGQIFDCYSTGSIIASRGVAIYAGGIAGGNGEIVTGGFGISVGSAGVGVSATPGMSTESDIIRNCYSTAVVSIDHGGGSGGIPYYAAAGVAGQERQTGSVSHCVALNREVTANGTVNVFASPILNMIGGLAVAFHSFYDENMAISRYKKGKLQKSRTRKNATALSIMQEQSWWQYPDGLTDQEKTQRFGFSFGNDETAPWVWNSEEKRPVLYWETATM